MYRVRVLISQVSFVFYLHWDFVPVVEVGKEEWWGVPSITLCTTPLSQTRSRVYDQEFYLVVPLKREGYLCRSPSIETR